MTTLGIVADDVTGGTTVGALVAREGAAPTVLFNHRDIGDAVAGSEETVIVSTDSRAMEPEISFGRVHHAVEQLLSLGARQLSKRIDTTCRGGIGPEVEGMMTALGEDCTAVVVPAMPESRRIVVGGYSFIDSVLLSRTDVARDVLTPVRESHIPTLLGTQFSRPVAHIALDDVLEGASTIAARLDEIRAQGVRVVVVDAVSSDDVDAIGEATSRASYPVVAVDPGPFSVRLAVHRGLLGHVDRTERTLHVEPSADERGVVAVVAGSASLRTHEQITHLAGEPGTAVFAADVLRLIGPDPVAHDESQRVLAGLRDELGTGTEPRVALLALNTVLSGERTTRDDLERASGLAGPRISTLLTHRLGALARAFMDVIGHESLAGAYLTGGDVMVAGCKALEARGLAMVDYVIPQVDQARIVGGPFEGLPIVCKGGLTGDKYTPLQSINRLFDERTLQS